MEVRVNQSLQSVCKWARSLLSSQKDLPIEVKAKNYSLEARSIIIKLRRTYR